VAAKMGSKIIATHDAVIWYRDDALSSSFFHDPGDRREILSGVNKWGLAIGFGDPRVTIHL
jgi:hypothetical protein